MSDLPEGWEWTTLGEIAEINPGCFSQEPLDDDEISLVRMPSVEEETGRLDAAQRIPYVEYKKKSLTRFQNGDVVFAKVTPCMENGKIAIADGLVNGRALGSTELYVVRRRGDVMPEYLLHYLLQSAVRVAAEKSMTGAVGLRRVPRTFLEQLPVPLPPLAEQRRIVAALEDHLSRLDAAVTSSMQAERKTGTWLSSARQDAVTGGRDEDDLADGWSVVPLRSVLAGVEAGKSFACEGRSAEEYEWGVLKVSAMTWGVFRPEENKAVSDMSRVDERYEVHPGDVLVSRANTREYVGAPVLVGETRRCLLLSDKSLRLLPSSGVSTEWLIAVLSSVFVRRQISARATGTKDSMRNISQAALLDVRIPLPPADQQAAVAKRSSEAVHGHARLCEAVDAAKSRAEHLRRSLLREAFAGRLVEQDPEDEPASVLLERIRAERESAPKVKRGRKPRAAKAAAKTASTDEAPGIDPARPAPPPMGKGTQDSLDLGL